MLAFCNHNTQDLWVAYMFYSPDACGGLGNFQTIGWYHVPVGACVTVYANSLDDVNNRYWYFYAENRGAGITYPGPVQVAVTDEAFNHCLDVGTTTSRDVGFRQFDVGDDDDHTVNLNP